MIAPSQHPQLEYIITEENIRGLESAGSDVTGDSFATDESRVRFVRKICKEVRSRPHTPARTDSDVWKDVSDFLTDMGIIHWEELFKKWQLRQQQGEHP